MARTEAYLNLVHEKFVAHDEQSVLFFTLHTDMYMVEARSHPHSFSFIYPVMYFRDTYKHNLFTKLFTISM